MRNQLFWALDALRGRKIREHVEDINSIISQNDADSTNSKIEKRLKAIIVHATKSVAYYQSLSNANSIADFPVIDKNTIRSNFEQFRSKAYALKELVPVITSGSTGTPFQIYHDKKKRERNAADTIYFAERAGFKIGEKLYYLKIWSRNNKKNIIHQKLQNVQPIEVLNLEETGEYFLRNSLNSTTSVNFLGYVSALETLCKTVDAKQIPIKCQVNSIITMSETLSINTKKVLKRIFSCSALSRYSNIENGILAQQTLDNEDVFTINTASYYIEIFDLNLDVPKPHGELGRIVVTDFFNYAMPMIRYDTGDLGVIEEVEVNGSKTLVLSKVEGRKLDQIFDTNGRLISSYIVYKNMWAYTEIDQYQFIQKGKKEYLFKICINGIFEREKQLIEEFKRYLGDDAIFKVEYVQEIPLLASGKRKKVVNEHQPGKF